MVAAMDAADNETTVCPGCQNAVDEGARVCSKCHRSLLVDVQIDLPVQDPRVRYQIARKICELAENQVFSSLRAGLERGEPVLLRGTTVERARLVQRELTSLGAPSSLIQHQARSAARTPRARVVPFNWMVGGAMMAALLLFGLIGWLNHNRDSGAPIERNALQSMLEKLTGSGDSTGAVRLAERAIASSATVVCKNRRGAGFFIGRNLLATNDHVLCPKDDSVRLFLQNGRQFSGKARFRDEQLDVALIEVSGDAKIAPLALGDATDLRRGATVYAVGAPLGLDFTLSRGIVSHERRVQYGVVFIQLDASINQGNSGGPLLDRKGRVVGIVSMRMAKADGLGFALPINYLYAGPKAQVQAPPDSRPAAWEEVLQAATREDREKREEFREFWKRPMLANALLRGSQVVAVVVSQQTSNSRFEFVFEANDVFLCRQSSRVMEWVTPDADMLSEQMNERARKWTQESGLPKELKLGMVTLGLGGCPKIEPRAKLVLVLEGAPEGYDRADLGYWRRPQALPAEPFPGTR